MHFWLHLLLVLLVVTTLTASSSSGLLSADTAGTATIEQQLGWQVRVVDLRWLVPLDAGFIASQAASARRVLVLDEGRHSGGVGEGVVTALVEAGFGHLPLRRVCGADTYTPLAGAAMFGLPSDNAVIGAALELAQEP